MFDALIRHRSTLILAALIALVASAGGGAFWLYRREPRPIDALWETMGESRPVEGRLSGEPYALFKPREITRGAANAGADGSRGTTAIALVDATIAERAQTQPSADSLRAVGAVALVRGAVSRAVRHLDHVADDYEGDAKTLNDLAVGYLERARIEDRPYDIVLAFDAADRAVQADPELLEARFNRALALERFGLKESARAAWEKYLALDGDSSWASEARDRLRALSAPPTAAWTQEVALLDESASRGDVATARKIVSRFQNESRIHAWEDGIVAWAEATTAGDPARAGERLARSRVLGDALAEKGDNWIRDSVATIETAPGGERSELVAGVLDLKAADELYGKGEVERSLGEYRKAEALFARRAAEAFVVKALLGVGRVQLLRGDGHASAAAVEQLRNVAQKNGYPYFVGTARWMEALEQIKQFRMAGGVPLASRAIDAMQEAENDEACATLFLTRAQCWRELGDPSRCYADARESLESLNHCFESSQEPTVYLSLAWLFTWDGHLGLAREVQAHAVRVASAHESALHVVSSHDLGSQIETRLGNARASQSELQVALAELTKVTDSSTRRMIEMSLHLTQAESLVASDPLAAAALATQTLESLDKAKEIRWFWRAYTVRARAHLAAGDDDATERDLRAAIDVYERLRAEVPDRELRAAFFEPPQTIYDEMVAFQIGRRGDELAAFNVAEAARARALLDTVSANGAQAPAPQGAPPVALPAPLDEVQRTLGASTALVEYAVLPDETICWIVTERGIRSTRIPIADRALEKLVSRVREAVEERDDEAVRAEIANLSKVIVSPIREHLASSERLTIVPDKALDAVPFAALVDLATNRYLVEDHAITIAPSAAIHIASVRRERELRNGPGLVVGDPVIDSQRFPDLPRLAGAEREARTVATLIGDSTLLLGERATKPAITSRIARYSVVHFACHAVADHDVLAKPALLLTPSADSDGILTTDEIEALNLVRTRLVVLAACRTGDGERLGREGVSSLVRSFLVAGSPAVIASLWNAEDRSAARLFTEFYRRSAAGLDDAAALRAAQLALLHGDDERDRSPVRWACFRLVGGSSAVE